MPSQVTACVDCWKLIPVRKTGRKPLRCAGCARTYRREYIRKWQAANRERVRKHTRKWNAANREHIREYQHQWYMVDREGLIEHQRQYRAANREMYEAQRREQKRRKRELEALRAEVNAMRRALYAGEDVDASACQAKKWELKRMIRGRK